MCGFWVSLTTAEPTHFAHITRYSLALAHCTYCVCVWVLGIVHQAHRQLQNPHTRSRHVCVFCSQYIHKQSNIESIRLCGSAAATFGGVCVGSGYRSPGPPTIAEPTHSLTTRLRFLFTVYTQTKQHRIYTTLRLSRSYVWWCLCAADASFYLHIHCARHVLLRGYFRETETKRARPPSQLHGGEAIHTYIGFVCVWVLHVANRCTRRS